MFAVVLRLNKDVLLEGRIASFIGSFVVSNQPLGILESDIVIRNFQGCSQSSSEGIVFGGESRSQVDFCRTQCVCVFSTRIDIAQGAGGRLIERRLAVEVLWCVGNDCRDRKKNGCGNRELHG
jgi:hypothetical protein